MSRRPKFKPEITQVKLNPEQAVLACQCWDASLQGSGTGHRLACAVGAGYGRIRDNIFDTTSSSAISS